jgi:hypothetical protein
MALYFRMGVPPCRPVKGMSVNWLERLCVAILLSAGSISATAELIPRSESESATVLLSWIKARAPYDPAMIDALLSPKVEIRSRAFFDRMACRGSKRECHRIAWYNGGDTIFLRDDVDLSSIEGAGFLLHEVVHYVQERSDKFLEVNECNRYRREKEAYDLQKAYLIEYGNYPTFAMYFSPPVGCAVAAN